MDAPEVPFSQFVLKVHSRCDLACDHCYVYEHADTSWRARPKAVPDEVLARTAERIAEHARRHGLPTVHVVLHGGEPLLAGAARLRRAAEALRSALHGTSELDLRIHTNGVLLDERFLDLFAEYDIKVGVSLDGDRAANDRHRRYADGRSSHPQVLRAVELLRRPPYRHLYAGLLCTVDVRNDPIAVYDALAALTPPRIDFLLPHATWDAPPLRPDGRPTPYATWLLAIHERWCADGRPMAVRTFDSIERTLRGGSSLTESLGLEPVDLLVIETDGTLEQADSLKTAYDGAPATGFDVFRHSLDHAARHSGVRARQSGSAGLHPDCRGCPVVRSCGGGLYAHRYRSGSGFTNPSVYCPDLLELITVIDERIAASRAATPGEAVSKPKLTAGQFAELASGYGSAETVRTLAGHELFEASALLVDAWRRSVPDALAKDAWGLLRDLETNAPEAVAAVVAHPYTRTWAVRLRSPRALDGPRADLGGLSEAAAAAAVRAGREIAVAVPVRDGAVRLPSLGRVLVPERSGLADVRPDAAGFTVTTAGASLRVELGEAAEVPPWWEPLRWITCTAADGSSWTVALEDTDPHRDSHGYPVAPRLDAAEVRAWTDALGAAWRTINERLGGYVDGLRTGLGVVTPLRPGRPGQEISAAARQAFGTVGIALPESPETLALLLVHEFQHVKLAAVMDLHRLFDPEDRRRWFAPWRPDPRPFEGLLQGSYAHLAVTEFWRAQAGSASRAEQAAHAEREFVRWREHTAEALETMLASGVLTAEGEVLVRALGETIEPWLSEPVSATARAEARRMADEARARWRRSGG